VTGGAVIGGVVTGGAVIGVDPGRVKAGYAVLDGAGNPLRTGICAVDALPEELAPLAAEYGVDTVALGKGTNAKPVASSLAKLGLRVVWTDEFETTLRARELYFAENPPRGWRRLLPRGLLSPSRPIDDYAAVLIGRRYLASPARGDGVRPPK
jgi:RNase H-fold protein (predicted Holliday junction resolvase)